jgi:hypothetical protein
VRNGYYDRKKKFQSSVWQVRDCYYDQKKKKLVRVIGKFFVDVIQDLP